MEQVDKYSKNIIIFSRNYQKEKEYWMSKLSDKIAPTLLPYDKKDSINSYGIFAYKSSLPEECSAGILRLCNYNHYGVFIILMTGITYILQKYTGTDQVFIGYPLAKDKKIYTNLFLPFVYHKPMDMTLKQSILEFKSIISRDYENQTYPLSDVFLNYKLPLCQDEPYYPITVIMEDIHVSVNYEDNMDIAFLFHIEEGIINIKVKYNSRHYLEDTIIEVIRNLSDYFALAFSDFNQPLNAVSLLTNEDMQRWNDKRADMNQRNEDLLKNTIPEEAAEAGEVYLPPQNEKETELEKIWSDILGKDKIGRNGNFFSFGGDSIKAIRLVAVLWKFGIKVKDVYNHPTIGELAQLLTEEKKVIEQEAVTGEVLLAPIQRYFFQKRGFNYSYYNQSVFLYKREGFDPDAVREVFQEIVSHHDMLRALYEINNEKVTQVIRPVSASPHIFTVNTIDLRNEMKYASIIEEQAQRAQSGLDIERGPLIKLVCFQTGEGDHLLIIIHHLLIDAFSWRIILEDFSGGYKQRINGEPIKLQDKTHSYKDWVSKLIELSHSDEMNKELGYWSKIAEAANNRLAGRRITDGEVMNGRAAVSILFSEAETQKIQSEMRQLNINIENLILAGALLAAEKTDGGKSMVVDLESHGRGEVDENINITRTVGWFTCIYPVIIDASDSTCVNYAREIRAIIDKVPSKGLGYTILKYLAEDNLKHNSLDFKPDILFNYLGEFDQDIDYALFQSSDLNAGSNVDLNMPNDYCLDINAAIIEKKLRINISYIKRLLDEERIRDFKRRYTSYISEVFEKSAVNEKEARHSGRYYIEGLHPFNELLYKDCFYNALFPVVKYYGKSIDVFLGNDTFIYSNDNDPKHIDADYLETIKIIDLINLYGIKTRQVVYNEDILNIIKRAISGNHPVIVRVDCYYLSQRKDTYQKKHWPHTLLIHGYDDDNQTVDVFEQSDINTLDYKHQLIGYEELQQAYQGLNDVFLVDQDYPSFIEFSPDNAKASIREKDSRSMFIRNLTQFGDSKIEGIALLKNFIEEIKEAVLDEYGITAVAERLSLSFNNILKTKYADQYRFKCLFGDKAGHINELAGDLIRLWRLAMNIMDKYIFSHKYKYESMKSLLTALRQVVNLEEDLHKELLKFAKELAAKQETEVTHEIQSE